MHEHNNRLIKEKSPYLLQHAKNPVDWYPWGEEAFTKAKEENKPIFLSIGYATCHWCHVMEEESFSTEDVAKILNQVFVNIKVDREELPAVDGLYMEFAQALMAGHGGWPLNLVLTPDLKPFFATTYLPAESQHGMLGIKEFAKQISILWNSEEKDLLVEQADKIAFMIESLKLEPAEVFADKTFLQNSLNLLYESFDVIFGGIKGRHKFPMPYVYSLLIAHSYLFKDTRALFLAELSVDKMLLGGIYDHVGGGFSRYTVDEKWQVPHFEKILKDNASMALALLDIYRYTKDQSYLKGCHKTLEYLIRDMKGEEGGYYSAQDADSNGKEGYYYTYAFNELEEWLPTDIFSIFATYYSITEEGNFEGRNILYAEQSIEEFCDSFKLSEEHVSLSLTAGHKILLEKRNLRSCFLDDKIITSANGELMDAFASAALYLDNKRYLKEAIQIANFIRNKLYTDGVLYRRYREGETRFKAALEDYVYLIKGLLTLFSASSESLWLKWAIDLASKANEEFKAGDGGYYSSCKDELILIRRKEFIDGAEGSPNAVHAENLLRLYAITSNKNYLEDAESIIKSSQTLMEKYSSGAAYHIKVLERYLDHKALSIVFALNESCESEDILRECLKNLYHPHMVVIWKKPGDELLTQLIPSLNDKNAIDGQTTLYVCYQDGCKAPVFDKEQIVQALQAL